LQIAPNRGARWAETGGGRESSSQPEPDEVVVVDGIGGDVLVLSKAENGLRMAAASVVERSRVL